jgi:protein gp37
MADATKIEWCDSTFNPWRGCTPVSCGPQGGCEHCYAAALSKRTGGPAYASGEPRIRTTDANWKIPVGWNRRGYWQCSACGWRGESPKADGLVSVSPACPDCTAAFPALRPVRRRVFCASMADVFDNEVDPTWRSDLFKLIAATPNLDWLLLTKRIGNAARMIDEARGPDPVLSGKPWPFPQTPRGPLANVWLGATVVTQSEADRDVTKLLTTPAARRFVSIEPMLGPVDLTNVAPPTVEGREYHGIDALTPFNRSLRGVLDWVIVGGESGAGARPMVLGWAKDIVRQCQNAGVPVLVKQIGARPTNREGEPHAVKDRKGGDMSEWPAELRVREFPVVEVSHA